MKSLSSSPPCAAVSGPSRTLLCISASRTATPPPCRVDTPSATPSVPACVPQGVPPCVTLTTVAPSVELPASASGPGRTRAVLTRSRAAAVASAASVSSTRLIPCSCARSCAAAGHSAAGMRSRTCSSPGLTSLNAHFAGFHPVHDSLAGTVRWELVPKYAAVA
jgi:hypothetical protein